MADGWDTSRIPDQTGRTAVVTGANSGLGLVTARELARKGALVVMACRNMEKGRAALADVERAASGPAPELEELDLGDLSSVRSFADRFAANHDGLDLLINNAGVMAPPRRRTADGFELQFGTNHLGHFLLTGRLLPLLLTGTPARIVNLSSAGHQFAPTDPDDPNFERTPYDPWVAYGRSKTANILFAVELDRRLRDRGVRATAIHPGGIVTELGRHLTDETIGALVKARSERTEGGEAAMSWKTVPQGAATSVWTGFVADPEEIGGRYCENCSVSPVLEGKPKVPGVMAYALDPDAAQRLWTRSEELVGETFDP